MQTKHLAGAFTSSKQGHAVRERSIDQFFRRSCVESLPDNTRYLLHNEKKMSVKLQQTQVRMTKLVVVTRNPDTAL